MALGEGAGLAAAIQARLAGKRRRRLAQRLHEIEVKLMKLELQVRDLEQQIFAADLSQTASHLRQRLPAPPHLGRETHAPHVSEHTSHQITSQD